MFKLLHLHVLRQIHRSESNDQTLAHSGSTCRSCPTEGTMPQRLLSCRCPLPQAVEVGLEDRSRAQHLPDRLLPSRPRLKQIGLH